MATRGWLRICEGRAGISRRSWREFAASRHSADDAIQKSCRLARGSRWIPLLLIVQVSASVVQGAENVGIPLAPVSGADGAFSIEQRSEGPVVVASPGGSVIYFRVPEARRSPSGTVYVEITYLDIGVGRLRLEYNGNGAYQSAESGYANFFGDSGRKRTAVFRLDRPDFRGAQNLNADLRVAFSGADVRLHLLKAELFDQPPASFLRQDSRPWVGPFRGPSRSDIDADTLKGKVLVGYQGWFRCPGDAADQGWRHWSRNDSRLDPSTLTVEMWPDMSDFGPDEGYLVRGFTHKNGGPARLFSSKDARTVDRHFEWMQQYGIDGAFVQRFLVNLGDPSFDHVLANVRAAAHRSGRTNAVCYDLTSAPAEKLESLLIADWKRLFQEMQLADDARYLRHRGKPVVFLWGFYSDRFDAVIAHRIIDFFQKEPQYGATLIGGVPWHWRTDADPGWAAAYRRFDVLSPWNVGNVSIENRQKEATTNYWAADIAEAKKHGIDYLPVFYPGFGWTNLKGSGSESANIPRRGGEFYWRQFRAAAELGVDMGYVAMFDEVDELTAIFKVTNEPPAPGRFATYEGLSSDWYLRLTCEGAKVLRGERKPSAQMPIRP